MGWPLPAAKRPSEKLYLVGFLLHCNSVLQTGNGLPMSRSWQQDFLLSQIILPQATPHLRHMYFVFAVQTLCSDLNLLLTYVVWTGAQVWVWKKYRRAKKESWSPGCLSKSVEPGGLWAVCLPRAGSERIAVSYPCPWPGPRTNLEMSQCKSCISRPFNAEFLYSFRYFTSCLNPPGSL